MILDTNAVSALFVGDAGIERVLAVAIRHQLPVVVIGEYRYGLLRSAHRFALQVLLDRLIQESYVLGIDRTTAEIYAQTRNGLRELGRPIPENDIWIGALALQHLLPIVSRDQHFDAIPGVERKSW